VGLNLHHGRFYGDEKERRRWQDPVAILNDLGLKRGQTFVDVGCGDGFFAIPAAEIVGKKGRVFAVDIDEDAIARLMKTAAAKGLENVETKVGRAEETVFCSSCADMVFFGIVLHDFDAPLEVLENARRMLKAGGQLVDLDWKKQVMQIGPPVHVRFSEQEAEKFIEKQGFRVKKRMEVGPYHYIIVAEK
jgi:ubiquinone/menaquinone biosynthesis C-methylase UbiE